MTNSVVPTAKIVAVRDAARRDTSERATFAMNAAMFWWATARSNVQVGIVAAGDEDHDRLADRPRRAQHEGGDDARERGGEHDAHDNLRLRGAEPERPLAKRLRHGGERVLADRCDRRQHEDAEDDAAGQSIEHLHVDAGVLGAGA